MNDKLIETVISRAGVVRVRNAFNVLLWLSAISLPLCLGGIYLFRDDAFFENTLCLASEEDAKSLSKLLRIEFPKSRFLISEVEPQNKAGWLPTSIWEFLNHPEPAHRKADA